MGVKVEFNNIFSKPTGQKLTSWSQIVEGAKNGNLLFDVKFVLIYN